MTGEETEVAELRKQFPLWQIWFVPWSTRPGGTFCAHPWAKEDDRRGVLHADTAEGIAQDITLHETDQQNEAARRDLAGDTGDQP